MTLEPFKLQPARDLGLSHRERVLSLQRESGMTETMTRCVWWCVMRTYLRTYHRLRVVGREHLPIDSPYVVIANHTSHLDAMVLASQMRYRDRDRIFPIAAGDTFFQTPVRATFSWACINALPMWRDNCGRHALSELRRRLLEQPCVYILFPEGTRSRDGELGSFRAGLGMLVAGAAIPVVPCYIEGAHHAMNPQQRWPRPRRLTLYMGKPLKFVDQPNRRAGWQAIAAQCEDAVKKLKPPQ